MDLVENDVDILHEEIKYLVGHLVGNDVDTLHEEKIHLVGFNFIRVIDVYLFLFSKRVPDFRSNELLLYLLSLTLNHENFGPARPPPPAPCRNG